MWQRRNWWVFIVAVGCLIGLAACQPEAQRLEYVGRVVDEQTLEPTEDMHLTLLPTSETTLPTEVAEVAEANPQLEAEVAEPTATATLEPPTATAIPAPPTPTATATPEPTATNIPTPTPNPNPNESPANAEAGDPWVRPTDNMTMRFVPSGTFMMGRDDAGIESDERPVRAVTLDGFWIDQTEVTNAQYALCVADDAGGCEPSNRADNRDLNGAEQPVMGVRWYDAEAYCTWAGGRLPTEAEWEYAARGPSNSIYPWGDEFDGNRANFCDASCDTGWGDKTVDDGFPYASPVGHYSPDGDSWVGAQDMAGNVLEWVADWYDADSYGLALDDNPTGPVDGRSKVLRGGSWYYIAPELRSTFRLSSDPTLWDDTIGFRCVHPGP